VAAHLAVGPTGPPGKRQEAQSALAIIMVWRHHGVKLRKRTCPTIWRLSLP